MKTLSLLTVALLGCLAAPLAADTITLENGRTISGTIRDETYAEIEYSISGIRAPQKVDTADVVAVAYGRTPEGFRQGEALAAEGEMGAAATAFMLAADDEDAPDHVRATAYVRAGEALLDNSSFPEALRIFSELLARDPDTRHLARALLGRGQSLFYLQRLAEAEQVFETLRNEVEAKGLDPRWELEGEFFLLWTREALQEDVLDEYRELRERATDAGHVGIANRCALRLGRVQLAQGHVEEAEPYFQDIIRARLDTKPDVVAGAFNGRGSCSYARAQGYLERGAEGDDEAAVDHLRDALLDFLRVHVNYRGVYKEQAEALYWAGKCFFGLAELGADVDDAELRGQIFMKRCREGYPATTWAERAANET